MNSLFRKIKNYVIFSPTAQENDFKLKKKSNDIEYDVRDEKTETTANDTVSKSYEENISYVRNRFNVPINNDIVIRELVLKEGRKAFIVFIDGMVSTDMVDLAIIKTLLEIPYFSDDKIYSYETEIIDRFIAHSQAITTNSMDTIFEEVNFGGCAVFVDGFSKGFSLDVREWICILLRKFLMFLLMLFQTVTVKHNLLYFKIMLLFFFIQALYLLQFDFG